MSAGLMGSAKVGVASNSAAAINGMRISIHLPFAVFAIDGQLFFCCIKHDNQCALFPMMKGCHVDGICFHIAKVLMCDRDCITYVFLRMIPVDDFATVKYWRLRRLV